VKKSKLLHLTILPVTSALAMQPAGAMVAAPEPTSTCAAMADESAAIERQLQSASQAMATSMAAHASEAVATTQTRNAVQSVAGRLNWVAPGLGTAIDLAADKVADAATARREAQIAKQRATVTPTFERAAQRLAELGQLLQDRGCAAKR